VTKSRRIGLVVFLFALASAALSIIFSQGYKARLNFLQNLPALEVVVKEGTCVPNAISNSYGTPECVVPWNTYVPGHYVGRVGVPTRYALGASTLVGLAGLILLTVGKEKHK
jgi:hypothetical protein